MQVNTALTVNVIYISK